MTDLDKKLADILERESIHDTDVLVEFDSWDSLTALSIIAMVDADYNINLSAEALIALRTISDLKQFIASNTNK